MQRLSLEELKAQKADQVKESLEAIKGGDAADCHCGWCEDVVNFIIWYNSTH
ncbi:hypothetical protein [Dyadobacter psychrotolerans]|uniref:hypothetical protein n=1 Tax=Dyadobacter psychrotolerans TaxID=2541721 RepID=UPI001404B45A|nr:hypothetical protein [Dyadobacter psychrotolerans]